MQKINIKLWVMLALLLQSIAIGAIESARAADNEDYNFSWLDPEKKIYVLQNRKYQKVGGAHVYGMGGIALAETFRTVYQFQPRIGAWFTEEFGIEAFYSARFHSVNNAYRAMVQANGTNTPLIREIKSQFGVLFNWAPWYAKINVFDTILYFDWYFSLGAGTMASEIGKLTQADSPSTWSSESLFAAYVGTGQIFHVSEAFKVRLDFLGHFYSARTFGGLAGAPDDKSIFSSFTFNLGVGLKL